MAQGTYSDKPVFFHDDGTITPHQHCPECGDDEVSFRGPFGRLDCANCGNIYHVPTQQELDQMFTDQGKPTKIQHTPIAGPWV